MYSVGSHFYWNGGILWSLGMVGIASLDPGDIVETIGMTYMVDMAHIVSKVHIVANV